MYFYILQITRLGNTLGKNFNLTFPVVLDYQAYHIHISCTYFYISMERELAVHIMKYYRITNIDSHCRGYEIENSSDLLMIS